MEFGARGAAVAAALCLGCTSVGGESPFGSGISNETDEPPATGGGSDPTVEPPDPSGEPQTTVSDSITDGMTTTGGPDPEASTGIVIETSSTGSEEDGTTASVFPGDTGTTQSDVDDSSSTSGPAALCDQPLGDMVPGAMPDAEVGVELEIVFNGPDGVYEYEWFILPWEPPGLDFTVDMQPNAEATMSGTPEEAGDFDFTVIANPTGDFCINMDALIVDFTLTVND